jgi:hypothetical protein
VGKEALGGLTCSGLNRIGPVSPGPTSPKSAPLRLAPSRLMMGGGFYALYQVCFYQEPHDIHFAAWVQPSEHR